MIPLVKLVSWLFKTKSISSHWREGGKILRLAINMWEFKKNDLYSGPKWDIIFDRALIVGTFRFCYEDRAGKCSFTRRWRDWVRARIPWVHLDVDEKRHQRVGTPQGKINALGAPWKKADSSSQTEEAQISPKHLFVSKIKGVLKE